VNPSGITPDGDSMMPQNSFKIVNDVEQGDKALKNN